MTEPRHTLPHWQEANRVQAATIRRLIAALEQIVAADTHPIAPNSAGIRTRLGACGEIAREALKE